MAKIDLSADRLRELLDYNPDTGIFTWRVNRGYNRNIGKVAGTTNKNGQTVISIDSREYYAVHLAWLYVRGYLPKMREIERINGDTSDNRISNLRPYVKSAELEFTQERVKNELDYDPNTGIFRWKFRPVNSMKAGDVAGASDRQGYVRLKLGSKTYAAHRLAWFYTHGVHPDGEVDHINGIRSDNRMINLRVVTRSENMMNQRSAQKGNASGFLGVHKNHGRWTAHLQVDNKMRSFGTFDTPEEAHQAYLEAKRRLHSTCTI